METARLLPSKKYLIGIGTIIGLVLLTFGIIEASQFFSRKRTERQAAAQIALESIIADRSQAGLDALSKTDTDGDGLPDWREALWKLDPQNPDTDGNGVSDGEQVRLQEQKLRAQNPDSGKPITATEQLARDIYTTYAVLEQSGQLSEETNTRLIEQIADSIKDVTTTKVYLASDLTIVPFSAQSEAIHKNKVRSLLAPVQAQDISAILESAVVTDPKTIDATRVSSLLTKYEGILASLVATAVPSTLSSEYLNTINKFSALVANLRGITMANNDPLVGLAAVSQLRQSVVDFASTYSQTY